MICLESNKVHQEKIQPAARLRNDRFAALSEIPTDSNHSIEAPEPSIHHPPLRNDYYVILSHGRLNAALSGTGQRYAQFFVVKVAPVLATTRQWHSFWQTTVPHASTEDNSIYHAMIALSAAYESKASGIDRNAEVTSHVNLALRSLRSQPISTNNMLILCRLLASTSQCTRDWKMAMTHLQHGWKILKEAVGGRQIDPDIAQLLGPTFLCASWDQISGKDIVRNTHPDIQRVCHCLEAVRLRFVATLSLLNLRTIESSRKTLILLSWSIMTRASCSMICLDSSLHPVKQTSTFIRDIKAKLLREGALLALDELQTISDVTFQRVAAFLRSGDKSAMSWIQMKIELQRLVENFLVQAAEVNPTLEVSTFWHAETGISCDIDDFVQCQNTPQTITAKVGGNSSHPVAENSELALPWEPNYWDGHNDVVRNQKHAHYLEFVCSYRSGLMPAFMNLR